MKKLQPGRISVTRFVSVSIVCLAALFLSVTLFRHVTAAGTISLTTFGTPYTQNFDTLANSGTASTVPTGWDLSETGSSANTTYTAGTGSSATGDTYSFGSASTSDRAFGGLQSGTLIPTIGSSFTNNTGGTITSLLISYTGEQWRLGAAGRLDRLDFQYSTDATSLTTGTWTDVDVLDFTAPITTGSIGALDGNALANRTPISGTISGLNIVNGATFWIRWTDLNASGSDDGLAVDDFSLTPGPGPNSTYTWIGGTLGADTDWQVATNWSPTRVTPATGDIIIFDGNNAAAPLVTNVPTQTIAALRVVNNNISVTVNASSLAPPHTLTMSGATGTDLHMSSGTVLTLAGTNILTLNIASGSIASVDGQLIFQDAAHRLIGNAANAVFFHNGALFTTASAFSGNAFGTGGVGDGTTNSVQFESGSEYLHHAGLSPFGTVGFGPVVVFQTGSEANWLTSSGFQASARTYADLVIGNGTAEVDVGDSGSGNFQFDNLTVKSPNSGSNFSSLSYAGTGSSTVTIKGNITSSGAGGGTFADVILQAGSEIIVDNPGNTVTFSNTNASVKGLLFTSDTSITTNTTLALARVLQMGNSADKTVTVNGTLNGGATGYVVGAVRQPLVPDGAYTFHVGTVLGYTPVALSSADSTSGDLTVRSVGSNHASTTDSVSLDEYWTLTLNGGTLTTALTFNYLDADVDGTESEYKVVRIEGSTIVHYTGTNLDSVANTAQVTGISGFSDWTLGQAIGPTAVKLTKFEATSYSDGVQLNWETGFEVDNLGYHVYREDNGERERVTPSVIAGSALTVGQGRRLTAGYTYSWFDPKGTPNSTYQLEAIDLDGSSQWAGPIFPSAANQQSRSPRHAKARLLDELATSPASATAPGFYRSWPAAMLASDAAKTPVSSDSFGVQRTIAAGKAVKIHVNKSGWYRLTQSQLVAAGLDPASDARRLQLFVDGLEVPISLSTTGARLNANDTLEFYGIPLDTPSTGTRIYWLVNGDSEGKRMIARRGKLKPSNEVPESFVRSFDQITELRERLLYFSNLLNGDAENIFGRAVTPRGATQILKALSLANESATQPRLEVALQGLTDGEHRVVLQLNGARIGEVAFNGREHPVREFPIDKSLLSEGDNTLSLVSTNGAADISLVDWVRLTYPRRYRAESNTLRFTAPTGHSVRIENFSTPNVHVVDVTDPNSPTQYSALASAEIGSYAITVQVQGTGVRTLLAFTEELAGPPAALVENQPSNWSAAGAGADMVIITHKDFRDAIEPLANLRRTQGLTVAVVDVEDVYDEFSYGARTPAALKEFLSSAAANWQRKARFLLLVGDSTWDPKNLLGEGANDFVPTKLIDTAFMETGSDDWFTDFSAAGMPTMATGRLPVRSAAQAGLMVSKILSYEQERELNAPLRNAVIVADEGFETQSAVTTGFLPSSIDKKTINRAQVGNDDLTRTRVLEALNQGPMIVNFYGHGSLQVWTDGALLDSHLASDLANANRLSVYVMMTCLNGFAHDVYDESLSESLLKTQNGAVAVWASSGFTTPEPQFALNKEFYRLLFGAGQMRLGEAASLAKAVVFDTDVRRTWTLYGDPSMRVK